MKKYLPSVSIKQIQTKSINHIGKLKKQIDNLLLLTNV